MIPSISGYTCDLYRGVLRFDPKTHKENFTGFFSNASGWGLYRQSPEKYSIEVLYGEQRIKGLNLADYKKREAKASKNGKMLEAEKNEDGIFFKEEVVLKAGDILYLM